MLKYTNKELDRLYDVTFNVETLDKYPLENLKICDYIKLIEEACALQFAADEMEDWGVQEGSDFIWVPEYKVEFKADVVILENQLKKTSVRLTEHLIKTLLLNATSFIKNVPEDAEVYFGHSAWDYDSEVKIGLVYPKGEHELVLRSLQFRCSGPEYQDPVMVEDYICVMESRSDNGICISEFLEGFVGIYQWGHGGSTCLDNDLFEEWMVEDRAEQAALLASA